MLRHRLVRALLEHYAVLAGYSGTFSLTLSRARFEVELDRRRQSVDSVVVEEQTDYAIMLPGKPPLIWVNPVMNVTTRRLCDTVAHEAVHLARPELRHGRAFNQRVAALLRLERL